MDDNFKKLVDAASFVAKRTQSFSVAQSLVPKSPILGESLPHKAARLADANLASQFHTYLMEMTSEFDKSLDDHHEVGARLVSFGENVTFHIRSIGYQNPSLIIFTGITDANCRVQLIQHVTQISILLIALPRENPEIPKKPFGFQQYHQQCGAENQIPSAEAP